MFTIGRNTQQRRRSLHAPGASPEEVAHFLGHKGSYMVKAIYAKVAVPKKVPTLE